MSWNMYMNNSISNNSHVIWHVVDATVEYRLVVQALHLNTLSKLTFADSKRFDSLVKDVFPGVPFRDVEYVELEAALREVCIEQNLVVIDAQVCVEMVNF